ncbi:MAG: glycosyltransferase family 2 protein [Terriglobia bacterium]
MLVSGAPGRSARQAGLMHDWRVMAEEAMNALNVLIIAYFFVGNGVYTVLMLVSIGTAFIYSRRRAYQDLAEVRNSGATPPVTIIIPAFNEEQSILETVRSALHADYPGLQVLVVDDGSSDGTLEELTRAFNLAATDRIYRAFLPTRPVRAFHASAGDPRLMVLSKEHGGKADALNAGINFCRTPYFCTLDADCLLEPDALLRLMRPVIRSPQNIIVSGGIIRIRNGCKVADGRIQEVRLPRGWLERVQVVEYLRTFLYDRAGWDFMGGTLIVSGAMAVFYREAVVQAGGFSTATVTEDMELIVRLHRHAAKHRQAARMTFTMDTVCWTECPSTLAMLGRQRRRWQLGLCQTLWLNREMLFNWKFGAVGLLSYPFHLFIEDLGAVIEFLGYIIVPIAFIAHVALLPFYITLVILSLAYAAFLSVGAVLLEEITYRRYPSRRDLYTLLFWSMLESFGFRQLILYFRVQGVGRFLTRFHQWESVTHAAELPAETA